MIKKNCLQCNTEFLTYPSRIKIGKGKFCSQSCNSTFTNNGFKKGHKDFISLLSRISQSKKVSQEKNPAWKGEEMGYDGIHKWARKHAGIPKECSECGKPKTTPNSIQWASKNHSYMRDLNEWVKLCVSCHRLYDYGKLQLTK